MSQTCVDCSPVPWPTCGSSCAVTLRQIPYEGNEAFWNHLASLLKKAEADEVCIEIVKDKK